jgi:hypothetical protein
VKDLVALLKSANGCHKAALLLAKGLAASQG